MKKVMVFMVAFMLLGSIGAWAGMNKEYKITESNIEKVKEVEASKTPVYGMSWQVTSSCGVTYTVTWSCLACLIGEYYAIDAYVHELVDSWCGNIDPVTGFPN